VWAHAGAKVAPGLRAGRAASAHGAFSLNTCCESRRRPRSARRTCQLCSDTQSKLPASTTMPPMTVPWPLKIWWPVVDQVRAVVEGLDQPG
jgi:hypothetical protein